VQAELQRASELALLWPFSELGSCSRGRRRSGSRVARGRRWAEDITPSETALGGERVPRGARGRASAALLPLAPLAGIDDTPRCMAAQLLTKGASCETGAGRAAGGPRRPGALPGPAALSARAPWWQTCDTNVTPNFNKIDATGCTRGGASQTQWA
jgi:hypothetical protein